MVSDSLALALSLAKGTAAVESTQFRNALAAASEHRAEQQPQKPKKKKKMVKFVKSVGE